MRKIFFKKNYLFILLFLKITIVNAQNKYNIKITYNVSFVGDSTIKDKRFIEDGFLFVNSMNNTSWFESSKSFDKKAAIDSLSTSIQRVTDGFRNLTWSVARQGDSLITFDTYSIMMNEEISDIHYFFLENINDQQWEILADTMKTHGYVCQKAILKFGNRDWIAWFAQDIPISEGPYKFKGLPGLIISVYDNQMHWKFDLLNIQKLQESFFLDCTLYKKYKKISKTDFFTGKRYFEKNYIQIQEASGVSFIDPANRNIIQDNINLSFKSRSNWIELYP